MTLLDTNLVSAFLHPNAPTRSPEEYAFVSGLVAGEGFAISYVTQFELRRGVEELLRRGEGRSKAVALEKFLDRVEVLGLDGAGGSGWNLAARVWADGRAHRPAIVFTDADLLIAATAATHRRRFATSEGRLADNLRRIGFPVEVQVVPITGKPPVEPPTQG
jgi:predicted nucleic acid-binding protein